MKANNNLPLAEVLLDISLSTFRAVNGWNLLRCIAIDTTNNRVLVEYSTVESLQRFLSQIIQAWNISSITADNSTISRCYPLLDLCNAQKIDLFFMNISKAKFRGRIELLHRKIEQLFEKPIKDKDILDIPKLNNMVATCYRGF